MRAISGAAKMNLDGGTSAAALAAGNRVLQSAGRDFHECDHGLRHKISSAGSVKAIVQTFQQDDQVALRFNPANP
ncbi:hypothetical protein Q2T42_30970 [Leptolyngbya boryana CZ1]|uniref:Uncharacterized protein n=1 Tax=Leptolyngbya boryana CZ1 TaxID=3060204 RepID=A0AA96WVS0_LEPBY|nr:hypothetical protein [Leptolyngbya boryana]WNZ46213.1 hypothetical protein Q2T42_30970 [Leptolyngbya boryana CZ1]